MRVFGGFVFDEADDRCLTEGVVRLLSQAEVVGNREWLAKPLQFESSTVEDECPNKLPSSSQQRMCVCQCYMQQRCNAQALVNTEPFHGAREPGYPLRPFFAIRGRRRDAFNLGFCTPACIRFCSSFATSLVFVSLPLSSPNATTAFFCSVFTLLRAASLRSTSLSDIKRKREATHALV